MLIKGLRTNTKQVISTIKQGGDTMQFRMTMIFCRTRYKVCEMTILNADQQRIGDRHCLT